MRLKCAIGRLVGLFRVGLLVIHDKRKQFFYKYIYQKSKHRIEITV